MRSMILVASVAAIVAVANAADALVLDQSFEPAPATAIGSFGGVFSSFTAAQTVTVGITGKLVGIDFFMIDIGTDNRANVNIQIFSPVFLGSQLDLRPTLGSQLLATGISISGDLVPETDSFVSFDFLPANFEVTKDQLLAIVLSSNGPLGTEFQAVGGSDGYPDGKGYHGDGLLDPFGIDFGFRTFVEPAAIPEPTTLALFAIGLAGLGFLGWRGQKAVQLKAA